MLADTVDIPSHVCGPTLTWLYFLCVRPCTRHRGLQCVVSFTPEQALWAERVDFLGIGQPHTTGLSRAKPCASHARSLHLAQSSAASFPSSSCRQACWYINAADHGIVYVLGVNMGDACNLTMQRIKQGLDRLHTQRHYMQQALHSLAGTPLYTLAMVWM